MRNQLQEGIDETQIIVDVNQGIVGREINLSAEVLEVLNGVPPSTLNAIEIQTQLTEIGRIEREEDDFKTALHRRRFWAQLNNHFEAYLLGLAVVLFVIGLSFAVFWLCGLLMLIPSAALLYMRVRNWRALNRLLHERLAQIEQDRQMKIAQLKKILSA